MRQDRVDLLFSLVDLFEFSLDLRFRPLDRARVLRDSVCLVHVDRNY